MSRVFAESATVYRGGGRRWFTKKAAINAEAKALFRQHISKPGKCDCDKPHPFDPLNDYAPYVCEYHDYEGEFRKRFVRRVTRLIEAKS